MGLAWADGWTTPFDAPYYPRLPVVYRNVELQYVFFEADPDAVASLLPEPLQPHPDGACLALGINVPFSSGYGAFREAVIEEHCLLDGQAGWYCSHVWHDGPRGIAAGREIYGTPKVWADLDVRNVEGGYLTAVSAGGAPILTITSTHDRPADVTELPTLAPSWRLKLIPHAERPEPALKQLVDGAPAEQDATTHVVLAGRGAVRFEASPFADLSALNPRGLGPAYYVETSFSEGFGKIALDYLAEEDRRGAR